MKLYKTTALLATAATAVALAGGSAPASAAVSPSLSAGKALVAVASADGSSAVVTVKLVCPADSTTFSALQVALGPQSNIDGAHSMPGKVFQCTGKAQKVAVVVTPGLAMLGYPGSYLVAGQAYQATVSLSTHTPDSQNPISVTPLADRPITVRG